MKFKFKPIETFTAPVDVTTPGGETQSFTAVFAYLDDKANEEVVKLGNAAMLREVWKGWGDDVIGTDDQPLPYSDTQRAMFLGHAYITNAVVVAYVRGRQGLRAKN